MSKKNNTEAYYYQFVDFLQSTESFMLKEKEYYLSANNLLYPSSHAMPAPFYLLNLQTQDFIHFNEDFVYLSGYSIDDSKILKHADFLDLMHAEDLQEYCNAFFKEFVHYISKHSKKQLQKTRFSINFRIQHKEGHYIQLLDQFVVLAAYKNNKPLLVLGTFTDITALKSDTKMVFTVSELDTENGTKIMYSKSFPETLKLTPKEKEIIALLREGNTSKSIAEKLNSSYLTVNTHRRNILEKLNLKNTSELINYLSFNKID